MFLVFLSCDGVSQREDAIVCANLNARYCLLCNENNNNSQEKKMHNEGLLIINKPKIHNNSYFEKATLYYFQLLVFKMMKDINKHSYNHLQHIIYHEQFLGINVRYSLIVKCSETAILLNMQQQFDFERCSAHLLYLYCYHLYH